MLKICAKLVIMVSILRRRRCGALIIELLLGFTLVTLGLVSVFSLFPLSERSAVLADQTEQARRLAEARLQDELGQPYSMMALGTSESDEEVQHSLRRGATLRTVFHTKVEVTKPYSGQEIYRVAVTVTWPKAKGSDALDSNGGVRLDGEKGALW